MSYSIPYQVSQSIEEREFVDHLNDLLADVLASTNRMIDLFFSDTNEIIQLIEQGSIEDND